MPDAFADAVRDRCDGCVDDSDSMLALFLFLVILRAKFFVNFELALFYVYLNCSKSPVHINHTIDTHPLVKLSSL